jgi:hypothetical protein
MHILHTLFLLKPFNYILQSRISQMIVISIFSEIGNNRNVISVTRRVKELNLISEMDQSDDESLGDDFIICRFIFSTYVILAGLHYSCRE